VNKEILDQIKTRLEIGAKKYGEELNPKDGREWLQESIEEMLDACVYLSAKLMLIKSKEKGWKTKSPVGEKLRISGHEVELVIEALDNASANTYISGDNNAKSIEINRLSDKLKKAGKV